MTRQKYFQNPGESVIKNYFSPIPGYPKNTNQIENPHFCAAIAVSREFQKAPVQNEPIDGVPRNTRFQKIRGTRHFDFHATATVLRLLASAKPFGVAGRALPWREDS